MVIFQFAMLNYQRVHREVKMVLKTPVTSQQHQHQRLGIPAASDSSPGFLAYGKNGGRRKKCPGSLHLAFPLDSVECCLFDVSYGFPMNFLWIPMNLPQIVSRLILYSCGNRGTRNHAKTCAAMQCPPCLCLWQWLCLMVSQKFKEITPYVCQLHYSKPTINKAFQRRSTNLVRISQCFATCLPKNCNLNVRWCKLLSQRILVFHNSIEFLLAIPMWSTQDGVQVVLWIAHPTGPNRKVTSRAKSRRNTRAWSSHGDARCQETPIFTWQLVLQMDITIVITSISWDITPSLCL